MRLVKNALTPEAIEAAQPRNKDYKIADGGGMYLFVTRKGSKSFRLKYYDHGQERRLVFGLYPYISLDEARRLRDEARTILAGKGDPSMIRRRPVDPMTVARLRDLPIPDDGANKVYFLQAANGHIKIGSTSDIERRKAEHEKMFKQPLTLLGWIPGSYAHEMVILRIFDDARLNGEWFRPSQRLLDFIADETERCGTS